MMLSQYLPWSSTPRYHPVSQQQQPVPQTPWILLLVVATISTLAGVFLSPHILHPTPATTTGFSNPVVPVSLEKHIFIYNATFGADPDSVPESAAAWDSIIPLGRGTVQYPTHSHKFATLTAVHQLHCLWSIRQTLYQLVHGKEATEMRHMRHCFDYLRQGLMCAADATLEPVDVELGGVTGWDVERVCRKYEDLMAWAEERRASNWRGFGEHVHGQ